MAPTVPQPGPGPRPEDTEAIDVSPPADSRADAALLYAGVFGFFWLFTLCVVVGATLFNEGMPRYDATLTVWSMVTLIVSFGSIPYYYWLCTLPNKEQGRQFARALVAQGARGYLHLRSLVTDRSEGGLAELRVTGGGVTVTTATDVLFSAPAQVTTVEHIWAPQERPWTKRRPRGVTLTAGDAMCALGLPDSVIGSQTSSGQLNGLLAAAVMAAVAAHAGAPAGPTE